MDDVTFTSCKISFSPSLQAFALLASIYFTAVIAPLIKVSTLCSVSQFLCGFSALVGNFSSRSLA
jgi:hypothetical protein